MEHASSILRTAGPVPRPSRPTAGGATDNGGECGQAGPVDRPTPASQWGAARRRRVLLVVESSRGYGRGCLQGIARYVRLHGGWNCVHFERSLDEDLPEWFPTLRPEGILARMDSPKVARTLLKFGVPIVDLRGRHIVPDVACVLPDQPGISRLAADHFLERGFTNLAFCGYPGLDFSDEREQAYVQYLAGKSVRVHMYSRRDKSAAEMETLRRETTEGFNDRRMTTWLRALPKPVGVFACNDVRGRQVLSACGELGVQVPEQVAVLGVDNDELVCDFVAPGLSSVDPDSARIGYEGAELLDALMRGPAAAAAAAAAADRQRVVPPAGVVTRVSSDVLAVEDEIVRDALALIRQHAFDGMNVEGLLDHLMVSRATLERRFAQVLRRSPRDEIVRVRIQRARQLLREADHNLGAVAELAGFKTASHFAAVFKTVTGQTPGEYRAQFRNG